MASDITESITELARAALESSPLMALRQLSVESHSDRLLLSGRVATFYQKQQAQELIRSKLPGVMVVNDVQVT